MFYQQIFVGIFNYCTYKSRKLMSYYVLNFEHFEQHYPTTHTLALDKAAIKQRLFAKHHLQYKLMVELCRNKLIQLSASDVGLCAAAAYLQWCSHCTKTCCYDFKLPTNIAIIKESNVIGPEKKQKK